MLTWSFDERNNSDIKHTKAAVNAIRFMEAISLVEALITYGSK